MLLSETTTAKQKQKQLETGRKANSLFFWDKADVLGVWKMPTDTHIYSHTHNAGMAKVPDCASESHTSAIY